MIATAPCPALVRGRTLFTEDAGGQSSAPDSERSPQRRTERACPGNSCGASAEGRCVDPRAAVSMATMSIFVIVIVIMASIARLQRPGHGCSSPPARLEA